jgi:hypothetical protein
MYRVTAPGGETNFAVNPPALPTDRVQLTTAEAAGIEGEQLPPTSWDLWRWLVLLAIVTLWLEWWLYYSAREKQRAAEVLEAPADSPQLEFDRKLEEEEESAFRNRNVVNR